MAPAGPGPLAVQAIKRSVQETAGLTEELSGSDAAALTTVARRDGGEFVLRGEKAWISGGDTPVRTSTSWRRSRAAIARCRQVGGREPNRR